MNLPIIEVLARQRRAEERELLDWQNGAERMQLRRPTGGDQLEWQRRSYDDLEHARAAMLDSLLGGADVPSRGSNDGRPAERQARDLADTLDRQLEEFDPLVAFSIHSRCPHCELESDFPIDLEDLALQELERIQRRLFHDVHQLARAYHWSEAEIFNLTPQRRARYLQLLEEAIP